eukprot:m.67193 g.67193  ORF g.67193 m.67193 type:complete len:268 (+) comp13809_c0_seq1:503-1306(+)
MAMRVFGCARQSVPHALSAGRSLGSLSAGRGYGYGDVQGVHVHAAVTRSLVTAVGSRESINATARINDSGNQHGACRRQASTSVSTWLLKFNPWRGWLNAVWNSVDETRIKTHGPDRVAAEWMLKLGGAVQVMANPVKLQPETDAPKWRQGYALPPGQSYLTGLDSLGKATATDGGLQHLKGLRYLQTLRLTGCHDVTDAGLPMLQKLPWLRELDLSGTQVTDAVEDLLVHHLPELRRVILTNSGVTGGEALKERIERARVRLFVTM